MRREVTILPAAATSTLRQLLTGEDVAALLRVGRSTVYEWARRGDLPSVVLRRGRGRSVRRWEPAAVEAFIDAGREETGKRAPALQRARTHGVCTRASRTSSDPALDGA